MSRMGLKPTPTPNRRHERSDINKGTILLAIMLVVGALSVAVLVSEGPASIQSIIVANFGGPKIPEIAFNFPNEDDRQNLTDYLIKEDYKEKDIGIIKEDSKDERYKKDGFIRNGWSYDFLYSVDELPRIIPISESVAIRNIEIIRDDGIRFEVKNFASQETSTPFYMVNAMVLVENPVSGRQVELEVKQIAWVEIGEEKMSPGEEREVIIENLFGILEERGHTCIKITSVWIEYEDFSSRK